MLGAFLPALAPLAPQEPRSVPAPRCGTTQVPAAPFLPPPKPTGSRSSKHEIREVHTPVQRFTRQVGCLCRGWPWQVCMRMHMRAVQALQEKPAALRATSARERSASPVRYYPAGANRFNHPDPAALNKVTSPTSPRLSLPELPHRRAGDLCPGLDHRTSTRLPRAPVEAARSPAFSAARVSS